LQLKKKINFAHAKTGKPVKYVKAILVFLLISAAGMSNAQLTGTKLMRNIQYSGDSGKITIIQDKDIVTLIDKHLLEESKRKGISGYRIRIFSNSGPGARQQGEIINAGFIGKYEGINTYFIFDSPFYLLYIGDFRTKSDAMKFYQLIEYEFQEDAFIVQSKINYPIL
jgi:hypothetical protein